MTRNFLGLLAVLALVGGADAQSLSDRLAGLKPKPAPTATQLPPSPFKPLKELGKFDLRTLPLRIPDRARDYSALKVDPFAKFPPTKPVSLREQYPDLFRELGKPLVLVRPMDAGKFPPERAVVIRWKKDFPKLGDDFEVQGTGTPNPTACATRAGTDKCIPGTYNCIAHTAGIKNVWVNPYQRGDAWDLYYGPLGYKKAAGTDTGLVTGVQKVAVYATRLPDGRLKQYTHAAVQEADGTWTSKLGSGPLIRHRTAESVGGGSYGDVVRVYERKR